MENKREMPWRFKKGQIPWNAGLTKETDIRMAKIAEQKKGFKPWTTGLTKETNSKLAEVAKKISAKRKRHDFRVCPCDKCRAFLATIDSSIDLYGFDGQKFYLGKLCKYNHRWHGIDLSLRYKNSRKCNKCVPIEAIKRYQSNLIFMREYHRNYINKRNRTDATYRLRGCIARAIQKSLKRKPARGCKNGHSWERLVGYTLSELQAHLEKQFGENMTWDNYGSYWHLDHIIPIAAFDFASPQDDAFKRCWALSNLQPLEARANKLKSDKLPLEYNEQIREISI